MQLKVLFPFIYSLLFLSFSQALDGDMYDFFLPNGLKVILMEKHVFPKIGLGVYYNVGSQDELPGQKGINKIALRAILDGTDKYPYEKLNSKRDEFEMGYGDRSGRDITYMYSQLPIDQLEFALDFESDRMVNVILTDNKLVEIKEEYKVQYEKYYTNDEEVAINNSLAEILPDNHPYKIDEWGIWEQIDTLSTSTCKNFLSQYYAPNNAVLVIVGDIIPEDATKLIYKYFGGIKPTKHISPEPDFAFEKNINDNIPAFFIENKKKDYYEHYVNVSFFMPSSRNDDTILMEDASTTAGDIFILLEDGAQVKLEDSTLGTSDLLKMIGQEITQAAVLDNSILVGGAYYGLGYPIIGKATALIDNVVSYTFDGEKVYESTDAGATWINISGTQLPNLPVNCIVFQSYAKDDLYIGTDIGVYHKDSTMNEWQLFNTGLPFVNISELEIQYSAGKLRAATFGRGVWESDLNSFPSSINLVNPNFIKIFPNPTEKYFTVTTPYKIENCKIKLFPYKFFTK